MSPIRYISLPSLRRCLDHSDYDSLDVPLFANRPLTQLLCKFSSEFECEDEPHVVWHRRRLGPAGNGKLDGTVVSDRLLTTAVRKTAPYHPYETRDTRTKQEKR